MCALSKTFFRNVHRLECLTQQLSMRSFKYFYQRHGIFFLSAFFIFSSHQLRFLFKKSCWINKINSLKKICIEKKNYVACVDSFIAHDVYFCFCNLYHYNVYSSINVVLKPYRLFFIFFNIYVIAIMTHIVIKLLSRVLEAFEEMKNF